MRRKTSDREEEGVWMMEGEREVAEGVRGMFVQEE